jgi:hypothetical protein
MINDSKSTRPSNERSGLQQTTVNKRTSVRIFTPGIFQNRQIKNSKGKLVEKNEEGRKLDVRMMKKEEDKVESRRRSRREWLTPQAKPEGACKSRDVVVIWYGGKGNQP